MDLNENTDLSDDEVFCGKLTLKEVKKRILTDIHQNNFKFAAVDYKTNINKDSSKIIEVNSEPNMILRSDSDSSAVENLKSVSDPVFNRPYIKPKVPRLGLESEDSFLEIEKTVTEQCISPNKSKDNNLDNTLDLIDFILNNGPTNPIHGKEGKQQKNISEIQSIDDAKNFNCDVEVPKGEILLHSISNDLLIENFQIDKLGTSIVNILPGTPINKQVVHSVPSTTRNIKLESAMALNTPINKKAPNLFKTPTQLSIKKESSLKRTPYRSKAYEHIASPIATYIKNCPQVPLVTDIHPKKPLPTTSSIPKLVKNGPEIKMANKENVMLPPLAYRSAKKTTVVNVTKDKWPQSNWAQKLTSSLGKPVVIKHDHRQAGKQPLVLQQEDSFADLSLHQAELSLCTEKLAFKKP